MTAKRQDIIDKAKEINKEYLAGKSISELAKEYNCGYNTILRRCIKEKRKPTELKDSYNWDRRLLKEKERLSKINPKDVKIVTEFLEDCGRLSKARRINYSRLLRLSQKYRTKPLKEMTKKDITRMMNKIEDSEFEEWTKQGYRIAFKKFYRWLAIEKQGQKLKPKEYPDSVNWINTTIQENKRKLPEAMITEADVIKLIDACDNPRDKALIGLLWDTGARIGEILNIKIKDLQFDSLGGFVKVQGKTGSRRIRLVPSIPYLATWKENHPRRKDPEAFLFCGQGSTNRGNRLSYIAIDSLMRRLRERSNTKKRIHAHAFRHSRASFLASRIREPIMKELFGWTQKSNMVATYVHLSGDVIDKEKLKADGIKTKEQEKEESKLTPKPCVRCHNKNPSTAKTCLNCGCALTVQDALIQDEQLKQSIIAELKKAILSKKQA